MTILGIVSAGILGILLLGTALNNSQNGRARVGGFLMGAIPFVYIVLTLIGKA